MGTGRFVAAVGLPGSGKSSVFAALAQTLNATLLREPEEDQWAAAVTCRETCGYVTALLWFRAVRVPLYFRAAAERDDGRVALLDSYYDKLCSRWLGAPGMEWLLDPSDPYFPHVSAIARLDYDLLPLADTLVVFKTNHATWERFVRTRGRKLDSDSDLLATYETQRYFTDAAAALHRETGIEVIEFEQDRFDSPAAAAERLSALLRG